MAFELRYPDETTPTASWVPVDQPLRESPSDDLDGFLIGPTPDLRTFFRYQISRSARDYTYRFGFLSDTDRANFRTFRAAVLGADFRINDPVDGFFTGTFHPEDGWTRNWDPVGANLWGVTIRFRRTVGP